jgi:hypothetical protein
VIARELPVHIADVADTTIDVLKGSSSPPPICSPAIGQQPVAVDGDIPAALQIRAVGKTLRAHRNSRQSQHHN